MKKILSILLLCFFFSATAQNTSTIQQLLDEGVTVGELLDAGMKPSNFYGKEFAGGLIFDIDTINGLGKVVAENSETQFSFATNSGSQSNWPTFESSSDDGMTNTQNIAEAYDFSLAQQVLESSHSGYHDWYIPTYNEVNKIAERYRAGQFLSNDGQQRVFVSGGRIFTSMFGGFYYSNYPQAQTASNVATTSENAISSQSVNIHTSSTVIMIREFNFNEVSPPDVIISEVISDDVTIESILDLGTDIEALYGQKYAGGFIFDIDTINGLGKVVAENSETQFSFAINSGSQSNWPTFESSSDDGMTNTQNIAEAYDFSLAQQVLESSHSGYHDWYIPTYNEANKIAERYRAGQFLSNDGQQRVFVSGGRIFTSMFGGFYYSNYPQAQTASNVATTSEINISSQSVNIRNSTAVIMIREFNFNEVSSPGSPALESFLETYTPPVVEEEVVSDANSFDVLNPLSYNGEFETVHHDFTNGDYIVPMGKTLIINQLCEYGGSYYIKVDNVYVGETDAESSHQMNLILPLVVSQNRNIGIAQSNGPVNASTFQGILINNLIESVHHDFINGDYLVPENKTLVIYNLYGSQPNSLYINSTKVFTMNTTKIGDGIRIPIYAESSNNISNPTHTGLSTLHGILIDNSNYTYATDYELIDALNEGMDSLATMSEVVVQENASLTTENAILLEDNEALMLIEYNYDSLQYVTEYLYSQVFDLQQELLVPNIDVDMAIGWNMIGFSCTEEKGATDALIDIVDEILIMKDNNGSVYMPEFGFNGIGDLTPGHGYQLKVTDYILDFNICE